MPTVPNPILTECAEHIAREHHEQQRRLVERMGGVPGYDAEPPPWDQLPADTRELAARTMYSLLYRGVIVCTLPEHRIKISLRGERGTT
jgi:hypothetical protein